MEYKINSPKYGEKIVLIDDEDYDLIKLYTWRANYVRGKFYAITTICRHKQKPLTIKMHRLILGLTDPKIFVDHKDQDGLNNKRGNIRIATHAENNRNVKHTKRSVTGYKGVSLYTKDQMAGWYAVVLRKDRKNYFGGYFKDPIEAAKKYDELAKIHHGEFAHLNFK